MATDETSKALLETLISRTRATAILRRRYPTGATLKSTSAWTATSREAVACRVTRSTDR